MNKSLQLPTALIFLLLGGAAAQAATKYWDIDGANPGAGGATPAGTWNTGATPNWTTDPTGASAATTFANNDEAVFSAGDDATGDFTVTVSGSPTVAGITLEEGLLTLTGGPIAGTPTVTINNGTLLLGSAVLPVGANVVVNSPGVLDMNTQTGANCAELSGNGIVTKNAVGSSANCILTVGNNDATSTFTGSILNNTTAGTKMGVTKVGTGTLLLHPPLANTLGAGTIINAGKLIAEEPQALGSFSVTVNAGTLEIPNIVMDATLQQFFNNGSLILASGGTLSRLARTSGSFPVIGSSATVTLATATSGDMLTFASTGGFNGGNAASVVTVAGPGTIRLSTGGGNYLGSWNLTNGTLQVDHTTALGTTARPVTLTGGTLEFRVDTGTSYGANVTVKGDAAITPTRITSGAGVTQTLGSLSISNFTLSVAAGANAASDTMGLTFGATTLTGNATFNVNSGATAATLLTLGAVGETGGARTLTKSGDGTLRFNGTNTFTGNTIISAGVLAVGTNGVITSSPLIDVQADATFDVSAVAGGFALGAVQTLKGNGVIHGNVSANGTLSPGASLGTLTFSNNLTSLGNLSIEVNKSLSPSSDAVNVSGALTNAGTGTMTVVNLGTALVVGDSFQIFNQPVLNGQTMSVLGAGVTWTNKLAVDGSIAVASLTPPKVPATNLSIAPAGPNSFNLGGVGAANSAYNIYAATNVTTPMANWWLLGTTNSSAGGVIQFLDVQATNKQRFYRFGQ